MTEIYDCQECWAWAWVSHVFTAGIRTNGHVKVENHINKALGGPKKTLLQLFENLNDWTNGQSAQEMMKTHDHVGPFVLRQCYKEMEESVYYQTEVVQCPVGVKDWCMVNNFGNDAVHISTKWLLRLLASHGLEVLHLLKIINLGTHATHFLAILPDNLYACDCCMGMNLGILCCHYFQALTRMPALSFHVGLV
ncbi:hypothetical protein DFH29DRAFT_986169 [Suillus ampliporus]|nr:hypothetical protein DFH29DRAFT_986169 [Suillus ampliporus]